MILRVPSGKSTSITTGERLPRRVANAFVQFLKRHPSAGLAGQQQEMADTIAADFSLVNRSPTACDRVVNFLTGFRFSWSLVENSVHYSTVPPEVCCP